MPELNHPPNPTWYGIAPGCEEDYVRYARKLTGLIRDERRRELEQTVSFHTAGVKRHKDTAREQRRIITEEKAQIRKCVALLDDPSLARRFEEGLTALIGHPALLGLRPDSNGQLIAHLRVMGGEGDKLHIGDFELSFLAVSDSLALVQTAPSGWPGTSREVLWEERDDYTYEGSLYCGRALVRDFRRTGNFVKVADLVIDRLRRSTPVSTESPDEIAPPTWQGIAPNLEHLLARTVELAVTQPLKTEIAEREADIRTARLRAEDAATKLRFASTDLREKQKALKELKELEVAMISEHELRDDLAYILALPGVMGVRFEHGSPVLHLRTTAVRGGKRYDMGDYEVILPEHQGRFSIFPTRRPNGTTLLYYMGEGDFCFGIRREEILRLFWEGKLGSCVHLLINTLNGINEYDDDRLERFPTIPMDAVWQNSPEGTSPENEPPQAKERAGWMRWFRRN